MANQEHLEILKQGVEVWNQWRQEHPKIQPDLTGADLSDAKLHGAALHQANLREATLSNADLSDAKLSGVDLHQANLSNADLSNADLSDAHLWKATLSNADLSGASLWRASLPDATLSNANLWYAYLREANLGRARLEGAFLHGADLQGAFLSGATFSGATLSNAELYGAILNKAILSSADLGTAGLYGALLDNADLSGANLRGANLSSAALHQANLRGADLSGANLSLANLNFANLSDANLTGADLSYTALIETNFKGAILTQCSIYGISAWNVKLEGAIQDNLAITKDGEPTITVDNLEVAQFIYLLLNNEKIRDVINTITSKVVLLLGRFTAERKAVLDALREAIRAYGYIPILFDFSKPANRDITETVSTLAHLSRFVVADITDAKSIPQELMIIIPNLPSVPVLPLILDSQHEYGMFEHFTRFPWVLPIYCYTDEGSLLKSLQEEVITPAEQKAKELERQ